MKMAIRKVQNHQFGSMNALEAALLNSSIFKPITYQQIRTDANPSQPIYITKRLSASTSINIENMKRLR